tara:strand:+ start:7479 stop:8552 length:1074 start_codon:yes stop_codon:yes gene_type:complete
MAFLDNTGTIVLDAILTDLGRKKMATGDFKVTKFSLGDDEIDYNLFIREEVYADYLADNSHVMDRAIISQSCFEALENNSAVINYGLTDFDRNDLLYLPVLKINYSGSAGYDPEELVEDPGLPQEQKDFARPYENFFYLSVNDETTSKLKTAFGSTGYIIENNNVSNTKIVIESGINNSSVSSTSEFRDAFIMQTGLLDMYYNVYVDSRFFSRILGPSNEAVFKNKSDGSLSANFAPLQYYVRTSLPTVVDKFDVYVIRGVLNNIFQRPQALPAERISAVRGPRGSAVALGLNVINELGGSSTSTRNEKYSIFGKTDQTLFGGSNKYDYIDSTIYVKGTTSGARIEIPLRVIRYAGT